MDKAKTINILAGVIVLIAFCSIVTMPLMIKRKAVDRAVFAATRILEYWKAGDSATGRMLWEDPSKFPIIYELESYQITNKKIQKKRGDYYVDVFATLNFNASSLFPSGKTWVFNIRQDNTKSTILDFRLADSM